MSCASRPGRAQNQCSQLIGRRLPAVNAFHSPCLYWLRGLDLNQRPLGCESYGHRRSAQRPTVLYNADHYLALASIRSHGAAWPLKRGQGTANTAKTRPPVDGNSELGSVLDEAPTNQWNRIGRYGNQALKAMRMPI